MALTKALTEASLHYETSEVRSLPEDLMVNILVKLPVKSLVRCRCVCKTWLNLIKSTNFVKMHLDYQKSNDNFLILCNRVGNVRIVISLHSLGSPDGCSFSNFDLLPVDICGSASLGLRPVRLCGSCDGLVCLFDYKNEVLILSNPIMREFRLLPRYRFLRKDGLVCAPDAVGLGFASITNDYKVIVIVMLINRVNHNIREVKAMVYNLSTNSWREIPLHIPLTKYINWDFRGILFWEAVHWIDWDRGKIVSFDVNTEMFSDVELPCIDRNEGRSRRLIIVNGHLALFTYEYPSQQSQCINIWVMHKYGVKESWIKQLTSEPVIGGFYPVLLWKNEAIIVKDSYWKLGLVSLVSHETKSSYALREGLVEEVVVYSESLISIK